MDLVVCFGRTEEVERLELKTEVEGDLKRQSKTKRGKSLKLYSCWPSIAMPHRFFGALFSMHCCSASWYLVSRMGTASDGPKEALYK